MVYILLAWLGLCLGSFVNALVWRIYAQTQVKSNKLKAKDLSILRGRSMCVHCHHTLAWYDLVPVASWLSVKGKCRYCHKPINRQYPIVELATASLFVLLFAVWPYGLDGAGIVTLVYWLTLLTGLIALFVYDVKWMILPDRIVYPLIGLSVLWIVIVSALNNDLGPVFTGFWGFVSCGGLFYVLFQLSDGKWIGGGDVKLGFLLGLAVGGPLEAFGVVFLSSVLGTLFVLPLLVSKKLKPSSRIPYGPFLIVAATVIFLLGDKLSDAVSRFLLLS